MVKAAAMCLVHYRADFSATQVSQRDPGWGGVTKKFSVLGKRVALEVISAIGWDISITGAVSDDDARRAEPTKPGVILDDDVGDLREPSLAPRCGYSCSSIRGRDTARFERQGQQRTRTERRRSSLLAQSKRLEDATRHSHLFAVDLPANYAGSVGTRTTRGGADVVRSSSEPVELAGEAALT